MVLKSTEARSPAIFDEMLTNDNTARRPYEAVAEWLATQTRGSILPPAVSMLS